MFVIVVSCYILLVSGGSQGQDYGVCYLQHGLQDGSNDNEEDDGEEEGSVNDLKLDEASLDSEDQQGDAFRHAPAWAYRKQTCKMISTIITQSQSLQQHKCKTYIKTDLCMVLSFMKAL